MQIAYQSSKGMVREKNEDAVGAFKNSQDISLAIIADGIGGNRAGEVASKMTVTYLGTQFKMSTATDLSAAKTWLSSELVIANQKILDYAAEDPDLEGMGTTLVAALISDEQVVIANIGDSRGYVLHANELAQLTEDHSYVNELVKNGDLTPAEAEHNPYKNIITKSLGINTEAKADYHRYQTTSGDQLLLCTDGLTNMVTPDKIKTILNSQTTLKEKCELLIQEANQNGGADNITVLLILDDTGVIDDA
ncbi:Stp1/IreP family PP2C-type Ser/Thr phosphatase [Lentilactobacillus senioris]|uniref:Stp1/IreP family PP2C-type Ser/Thr phosphatase n=1 Tax=Lentilactobacillus senioris TaxID=931534 RepID=UPI0022809FAF|nr:Stp1/IreP family PP2C-type Ser/Thr phosphatase [Lentilactobacillus senioris]MCY9806896.1 Stp1/IreP family PP2C-type Ser/Thr phosphatase [Lentilactobacillus senioris]